MAHDNAAPHPAPPVKRPTDDRRLKSSPFWRFSLRLYASTEVQSACLALQDKCGVDVNVLMFVLWAASERSVLGVGKIRAVDRVIKPWRTGTVVPLRTLRRALKAPPRAIVPGDAEHLRARIKAAELMAENLQQDAMYRFAQSQLPGSRASSASDAARRNLAAYQSILGPFPKAETDKILKAFDGLESPR